MIGYAPQEVALDRFVQRAAKLEKLLSLEKGFPLPVQDARAKMDKGRDLIKQTRKHLLELARPMLESLVHEIAGVKVLSMHHDISTVTGEEVVIFSLTESPSFE